MSVGVVWLPDGGVGPGRLGEVVVDVVGVGPAEVVLPEVTVRDERGGRLFAGGGLVFDPAGGGGMGVSPVAEGQARAFGVVNTAFHVQRALRFAAARLGHGLPRLLVRIGLHERWGGGHYRLPGPGDAEPVPVRATGEAHLGGGRALVPLPGGGRYFHAPAHNPAIIYHETAHHVCRHTADFRLNRLRPPHRQTNTKTALDEGTADLLTAILLGTPDIYGWHRRHLPGWDQRRRRLHPRWDMARFHGGHDQDPHTDGTIWASACWTARQHATTTHPPNGAARFDTMLLRGLDLAGPDTATTPTAPALRHRRYFSRLLTAMTHADPGLAPTVLTAMATHGIHPGATNAQLRDTARTHTPAASA